MHKAGRVNHRVDEEDYQRNCLARYICDLAGGLDSRRSLLNKLEKRLGKLFADELKVRVRSEWEKRHTLST